MAPPPELLCVVPKAVAPRQPFIFLLQVVMTSLDFMQKTVLSLEINGGQHNDAEVLQPEASLLQL